MLKMKVKSRLQTAKVVKTIVVRKSVEQYCLFRVQVPNPRPNNGIMMELADLNDSKSFAEILRMGATPIDATIWFVVHFRSIMQLRLYRIELS